MSASLYAGWPDERAARTVAQLVRSLTTGEIPTPEDDPAMPGVAILKQGRADANDVLCTLVETGDAAEWDPARLLAFSFLAITVGERPRPARDLAESVNVVWLPFFTRDEANQKYTALTMFPTRDRTVEVFPMTRGLAPLLEDVRAAMLAPDGRTFVFVNMIRWSGYDAAWPTEEGDTLAALDMEAYYQAVRRRAEHARARTVV